MSKRNNPTLSIITALILGFGLAGTAGATTALEQMVQMHSASDEYYFFEADRKQIVDYNSERIVRVCTGESRHLVPLKITYDGSTAKIAADECMRVEAKTVYLEPARRLDANWTIKADVETLN